MLKQILICMISLVCTLNGQQFAPLFSNCGNGIQCEPPSVCKYNVCLPDEPPTPIYSPAPNHPAFSSQKAAQLLSMTLTAAQKQHNQMTGTPINTAPIQRNIEQALNTPINKLQFSQLAAGLSKGQVNQAELQKALEQVLHSLNQKNAQISAAQKVSPLSPTGPIVSTVKVTPPEGETCQPKCMQSARCISNRCVCFSPLVLYSPIIGCIHRPINNIPQPSIGNRLPPPQYVSEVNNIHLALKPAAGIPTYQTASLVVPVAPPAQTNGLFTVPQALPGDPCSSPGTECTAGSLCHGSICVCPPQLQHDGNVCVSKAIYGQQHPGLPGYANV